MSDNNISAAGNTYITGSTITNLYCFSSPPIQPSSSATSRRRPNNLNLRLSASSLNQPRSSSVSPYPPVSPNLPRRSLPATPLSARRQVTQFDFSQQQLALRSCPTTPEPFRRSLPPVPPDSLAAHDDDFFESYVPTLGALEDASTSENTHFEVLGDLLATDEEFCEEVADAVEEVADADEEFNDADEEFNDGFDCENLETEINLPEESECVSGAAAEVYLHVNDIAGINLNDFGNSHAKILTRSGWAELRAFLGNKIENVVPFVGESLLHFPTLPNFTGNNWDIYFNQQRHQFFLIIKIFNSFVFSLENFHYGNRANIKRLLSHDPASQSLVLDDAFSTVSHTRYIAKTVQKYFPLSSSSQFTTAPKELLAAKKV